MSRKPNHLFTILELKVSSRFTKESVSNILTSLVKLHLIERKSRGIYQYIQRKFKSLQEYMVVKAKRKTPIQSFIEEVLSEKIHIRLHYLKTWKKGKKSLYQKYNWTIITGKSKGKGLKEVTKYGLTKFIIYPNGTIEVQYNGTFIYDKKKIKVSITEKEFDGWKAWAEARLNTLFGTNFRDTKIRQIGFNYDYKGQIKKREYRVLDNFTFEYLENIFEFYEYIDEEGDIVQRIGLHPDVKDKDLDMDNLWNFGLDQSKKFIEADKILKDQEDMNKILPKQNKQIINYLSDLGQTLQQIIPSFQKTGDHIIDKVKNEMKTTKEDVSAEVAYISGIVNQITTDVEKFKTSVSQIVQNQQTINQQILNAIGQMSSDYSKSQKDLIDAIVVIQDQQNKTNSRLTDAIDKIIPPLNDLTTREIEREKNKSKFRKFLERIF